MPRDRRTRAARLIDQVLSTGTMSHAELCAELFVNARQLEQYRGDARPMPLERQLILAELLLARSSALRREAAALRGQVYATIRYHAGTTERHDYPPLWANRREWGEP